MLLTKFLLFYFFNCLPLIKSHITSVDKIEQEAANRFREFIRKTRFLTRADPQQSAQCFEAYQDRLKAITAEYKRSYNKCTTTAERQKSEADEATNAPKELIQNLAEISCSSFKDCEATKKPLEYFNCAVSAVKTNIELINFINNNATDSLEQLRKNYGVIESDENRCKVLAERVNLEDTARIYREMQECLEGRRPLPQTSTTTILTTIATTEVTIPVEVTTEEEVTTGTTTATPNMPTDKIPTLFPYIPRDCN